MRLTLFRSEPLRADRYGRKRTAAAPRIAAPARQKMQAPFFLVSGILGATLTGASCSAAEIHTNVAAEIVKLLDQMPGWPLAPAVDEPLLLREASRDAAAIEDTMHTIAGYDLASIRKALEVYQARCVTGKAGPWDELKLVALNKFLFDIPSTVRRDSEHFRLLLMGCRHMPIVSGDPRDPKPSDEFDVRWPWREGADGKWRFVIPHRLLRYSTPPYDALRTFDQFRQVFGRRAVTVQGSRSEEGTRYNTGVKSNESGAD
ncbi:MAG TPA: hypothetical protein EYP04_08855 [Anaerolineae bacterium]|nr:hypothetical protein [Anaerolineae bacterium]